MLATSSDGCFRRDPRDFSRKGPLTPELLTTLLLYMVADGNRRGYEHLLSGFWDEARSYGLELPTEDPISAASFCTARHKITSELLRHILHEIASTSLDTTFESQRWHGKRVFAIDGTKINLQRGDDLEEAFGIPEGAYCPQVLASVLLDVCAKAPVDVVISPFASSEREHLLEMLPSLQRGDVLVLDRGYPSHEVLQELAQHGVDFLIRVPSSHTFAAIDELRESAGDDYLYWVDPPQGSPPEWTRLALRAVRLTTADGSESFFLTTLRGRTSAGRDSASSITCAGRPRSSTSSSRDPTSARDSSAPSRLPVSNRRSTRSCSSSPSLACSWRRLLKRPAPTTNPCPRRPRSSASLTTSHVSSSPANPVTLSPSYGRCFDASPRSPTSHDPADPSREYRSSRAFAGAPEGVVEANGIASRGGGRGMSHYS